MERIVDRGNASSMIIVFGDAMIDSYRFVRTVRANPESDVAPLLNLRDELRNISRIGGAYNVVEHMRSLGCEVHYATKFDDANLPHKTRWYAVDECGVAKYLCRIDNDIGRCEANWSTDEAAFARVESGDYDVVVVSDYDKGAITDQLLNVLRGKPRVVVDPKGDLCKYHGVWCLKPNLKEFMSHYEHVYGCVGDDLEFMVRRVAKDLKIEHMIVTMGGQGAAYCNQLGDGDWYEFRLGEIVGCVNPAKNVVGAGDVFTAVLAAGVQRFRQRFAKRYMLRAIRAAVETSYEYVQHGVDEEWRVHDGALRALDRDVLFTNGCFDLLHKGHRALLQWCARWCLEHDAMLVVAVNGDDSVRAIKGEYYANGARRPYHGVDDRCMSIVAYLETVGVKERSVVEKFDSTTPIELVKKWLPKMIVKGYDYEGLYIIGEEWCENKFVYRNDALVGVSSSRIMG